MTKQSEKQITKKFNIMKRNILIIAAAIISMTLNACTINLDGENFGNKTIKGDGNIVTQSYDVSAFNEISSSLPATVNFTASGEYSCVVRVDENILEYLEIKVKEGELIMRKPDKTVNLRATEFVIEVTAPSLEEISLAGSGTFNVLSPMDEKEMEVFVAGSGDINFREAANVKRMEMQIAGSGDLRCVDLTAKEVEIDVAGSGSVKVESGIIRDMEASIAGSGSITSHAELDTLNIDVAGSGDIVAKVNYSLNYSIIGSGDIKYYGDPTVKGDKVGSGKVIQIEAPAHTSL
jgi:hypothetical protein